MLQGFRVEGRTAALGIAFGFLHGLHKIEGSLGLVYGLCSFRFDKGVLTMGLGVF